MSYIIRSYASWFLHVGLVVGGGLLLFVGGCDTGMELTGERPVEPLRATPYEAIANKQYEALKFIDSYVDGAVERLGKRPDRAEMKALIVEAQAELMAQEGYGPEEIAQVKDQLGPHLERPRRVDDSQSLSTILTKQGFSAAQRRFFRRIDIATKSTVSYNAVRRRLRTIVEEATANLSDGELSPILSAAANLEGYARFLEGKSIPVFGANVIQQGLDSLPVAGKQGQIPICIRGPEERSHFHRGWKYGRDAVLTGMTFCGFGALIAGVGCVPMGAIGVGFGLYWQYQDAQDEYLTALRSWCDECVWEPKSPISGVNLCLVRFPGDYTTP